MLQTAELRALPNPRLQRTRLRAPLSRKPFGDLPYAKSRRSANGI